MKKFTWLFSKISLDDSVHIVLRIHYNVVIFQLQGYSKSSLHFDNNWVTNNNIRTCCTLIENNTESFIGRNKTQWRPLTVGTGCVWRVWWFEYHSHPILLVDRAILQTSSLFELPSLMVSWLAGQLVTYVILLWMNFSYKTAECKRPFSAVSPFRYNA